MLQCESIHEDVSLAAKAFYSDISASTGYLPFIAAAGMLFTQANDIARLNVHL
jgi:hypothetical protein